MQLIERLRRDEGGFTLVELLTASMIGTIVLFAAFSLVDATFRGQRSVDDRIDAVTTGRNSMEQITRQLRSQICLGKGLAPVVEAVENRIVFYASVAPAPATASGQQKIQKRTLQYVPDGTTGRGSIVETVIDGNDVPPPNVGFTATPRTRTIVSNVAPVPGRPVFRFYKYDPDRSPDVELLNPPVSAANRQLIVQVQTTYETFPTRAGSDRSKTVLDNKVTVRTADPTDPTRSPKCI
jgi:hypothetical protein